MRKILLLLFATLLFLQIYAQQCDLKIASSVAKPCEGQTINFTTSGIPSNATLQWRRNGVDIDKAIAANYSANQAGTYEVKSAKDNWAFQYLPSYNIEPYKVYFQNENKGWIIGGGATPDRILGTVDGGITWNIQGSFKTVNGSSTAWLQSIDFDSGQNGCAVGYGSVWTTSDGGIKWNYRDTGTDTSFHTFRSVRFSESKIAWAVGEYYSFKTRSYSGMLVKSTDSGKTWIHQKMDNIPTNLNYIFFSDSKTGWIASRSGKFFKTIDGGQNWTNITTLSGNLQSIYFVNNNTGWVISEEGNLYKTADGGKTWTSKTGFISGPNLGAFIHFANEKVGAISTEADFFYKTIDGGETWTTQKVANRNFVSVFFVNPQKLFSVSGFNSTVGKYETTICTSNTVTINPKPAAPTVAWSNTDAKLTATSTSAGTLAWLKGTTDIPNITTATYQPTSSGSYSVRVTDANGCAEVSKAIEITILSSENPLNDSGVSVYPNPSSNGIFKVAYTRFSNEMEASMQIIGLDGMPLNSQKMVRQNNVFEGEINASNLSTGIYFLQVVSGEQKAVVKISVAK
jgi:photosystem II stability/assembly factor-like uncharacterized protein